MVKSKEEERSRLLNPDDENDFDERFYYSYDVQALKNSKNKPAYGGKSISQ